MPRIISIETSTELCSVALSENGRITAYRESDTPRAHASMAAKFIKDILDEGGLALSDCDAVCVSMGPGSYTGLRVGVSTAKGLCFGGKLPLLAVSTPEILVWQAIRENMIPEGCRYIIPMIDARRMEAYTAIYDTSAARIRKTEPEIITEDSFREYLDLGPVLFIGDAAGKCSKVISNPAATFAECCPKASSMVTPAEKEYADRNFRDTAYFEPFYLKEFVATVSKKKI